MSHYKPYPVYKDSGVEWLGRVPEHWGIRSVKTLARLDGGAGFPDDEQGQSDNPIPFFKVAELASGLRYTANTVTEETAKRLGAKIFPPSTLVFAKVGAALLLNRRCLLEMPACLDNNMMALLPGAYESQWLYWVFSTLDMGLIANPGAVPSINQEQVGNIRLGVPTTAEQKSISQRLGRETARIDALIEKKTRFIELLREKRQALITHAVTKGLDPNAKMKDSGVEWLGEVPEHWRVMAIKHIVATPITDGPHETPEFLDEGVPFVSAEAVSSGRVDFAKIRGFISQNDHERYSQKYCPKRGDIFMIKSGATTGVTAIVETDDEFNIWSPIAVIRCGESADPYFVLNFMRSRSFQEAVALSWSYGTQQNIGMGVIGNLVVTVPPLDEQKCIALSVHAQCVRLDDLIDKTECSIALLKERRSALITAAVTGQIDLREAL